MFFGSFSIDDSGMKDAHEGRQKDMVGRFPHHYIQQQQQQQQHQQQQQKRECFPDEVHSTRSSGGGAGETKRSKTAGGGGADANQERALVVAGGSGDGATIEVAKRPRGRPPGSKNKPKPPVVITREAEPAAAMRPHVLEIPNGYDVVDSLARFSRRRNLGICVLAGTGTVANVTLRQPSVLGGGHPPPTPPGAVSATVSFHGRFEILSISATFLPPAMAALSPAAASGSLSISLAGPQGQVVGGTVAGPLMASGTVVVMAAAFSSPTFHRLPAEDDVSVSVSVSGGGDHEDHDHQVMHHNKQQQQHHHHHNQQQRQRRHNGPQAVSEVAATTAAAESSGMSIYSGHLPTDVIWAPTARPPHPHPY